MVGKEKAIFENRVKHYMYSQFNELTLGKNYNEIFTISFMVNCF